MKTTIYDLLGMIKDGKAPNKILFKGRQWEYTEDDNDYVSIFNEWLFDEYVITNILNDEVEILETTITYKQDKQDNQDLIEENIMLKNENLELRNKLYNQDNIENNKQDDKKDKLKATLNCIRDSETILGGEYYVIHSDFIIALEEEIDKINKIIDKINEL